MSAASSAAEHRKTVFLVRHAQSEQNIATARLERGDVTALVNIVGLGLDAPVSAAGQQQLEAAAQQLEGFAEARGIEVVVHSPYQRAVATAQALFSKHPKPLLLLPPLHERTLTEWMFPWIFDARIQRVRAWLNAREERVIALVGHGQFFKRCLDAPSVQPNVSIIETTYSSTEGFVPFPGKRAFEGFPEPAADGSAVPSSRV